MKINGSHPLWTVFTPEADERRFVAGMPIVMFLILLLWGSGHLLFIGFYWFLAIFAAWWVAYLVKFGKCLRNRGELKRAIIAPAAFFALLVGACWWS